MANVPSSRERHRRKSWAQTVEGQIGHGATEVVRYTRRTGIKPTAPPGIRLTNTVKNWGSTDGFFFLNQKCIDYVSVYSNITTVSLSDYSFEYCDVIDLNLLN